MTDPSSRATPVEPAEWRRMLSESQASGRKPIVLVSGPLLQGADWSRDGRMHFWTPLCLLLQ